MNIKQICCLLSPRFEAEILLSHVLNCSIVDLKTWPEKEISEENVKEFESLATRRKNGEPIAYITGHKDFWDFTVKVTQDVMIPRPETEILVEKALEKIPKDQAVNILDLGTGSGVIAIAIARERPKARVFAVDCFSQALELAKYNAKQYKVDNVVFYYDNWFEPLKAEKNDFFCIISNPPYIAEDDPYLAEEVIKFEPKSALIADDNGLQDLKLIISSAKSFLAANGCLLVEHGFMQAYSVVKLFVDNGYGSICSYSDLSGNKRVVCGTIIS